MSGPNETGLATRPERPPSPLQKREEERLTPWIREQRKERGGRKAITRLQLRHVVQRGAVKEPGEQLGVMDVKELQPYDDAAVARILYDRAQDDQEGRSQHGDPQQYTVRAFIGGDMEGEPFDVILFWIGTQRRPQDRAGAVDTTPANESGLTSSLMRHNEHYVELICEQVRNVNHVVDGFRDLAADLVTEVKALREQARLDQDEVRKVKTDRFDRKQKKKELQSKLNLTNEAVEAIKLIAPPIAQGLFNWAGIKVDIPAPGDPMRKHMIALAQSLSREQFQGMVLLMKNETQLASWMAFWAEVNKAEQEELEAKTAKGKNGKAPKAAAAAETPAETPAPEA